MQCLRVNDRLFGSVTAILRAVVFVIAVAGPWSLGGSPVARAEDLGYATIELKSGDVLRGRVVAQTDSSITIEHPELGTLTISIAKIVRVREMDGPPAAPTPAVPVAPSDAPMPEPPPADEGSALAAPTPPPAEPNPNDPREETELDPFRAAWRYYASIAFAGEFSTSDEVSIRAAAGATYETKPFQMRFDGEYYFRTLDGATTDNNLLINGIQEWTLGETKWLFFAQEQYQYDEFQSWEHRVSLYGGPGYRLIQSDAMDLTLRGGFGATYEFGVDDWRPQALFAEDFSWQFTKRQRISINSSIAPNVSDLSDYLLQGAVEYALAVGETKRGLALTLGLRDIYDSSPPEGSTHNDLRVYGGLRYDF
jgi:putative salt-induced outer membrane protein YdiY